MQIKDITNYLEAWAPPSYQESYDNSGLLVGDAEVELMGVLISLDVTEAVIEEAITEKCNLIIAHHPLIFKGLKRITGSHWVERCVIKAIQNEIAIYAIHTNLDHVQTGVNMKIAQKIGLQNLKVLSPKTDTLTKLVTFAPQAATETVLQALYAAGAGEIGHYDHCSFQVEGVGTFRPDEGANPHIGTLGEEETVNEKRIEVVIHNHLVNNTLKALKENHPYEEVAYYLTPLANANQEVGAGMIGELPSPMSTEQFLQEMKVNMQAGCVRHTPICKKEVLIVAVCGGSGGFLLSKAISAGADVFVTADFKYHEFFEADQKIVIADIGHYESEQFTKDLLYDNLREKFTNIALRLTQVNTNPLNYL